MSDRISPARVAVTDVASGNDAAPAPAMTFIGAFESSYMPHHDVDVVESSGHERMWREDLALARRVGVETLRYPVRWHRIEASEGDFDWRYTDEVLGHLRDDGFTVIVDLLHHCSYPRWMDGGFRDRRFAPAYLRYCEAFAKRYPWVPAYTLLNEPFTTLFLTGHEGVWPPYGRGMDDFVATSRNVIPALTSASRMYAQLLPEAVHVYTEPCEGHSAGHVSARATADVANDRRFFVLDLVLGYDVDDRRPFFREVAERGGGDLLEVEPGAVDVLGLDYYAHLEWSFGETGAMCPSPTPVGLATLILEYWDRYSLPMILAETNVRGYATDRVSWLKYTLEQCERARAAGAVLDGYCWFPFVDSTDWDSLLANADGHIDPVGVFWLDEDLRRRPSPMSHAYAVAARGVPAAALPAYRFQPPLDRWLRGLLPQMEHWEWLDPDQDGMCETTRWIHAQWEAALAGP